MSSTDVHTVLVALDGSEFAEGALEAAKELASRSGAALHLVSVRERGPDWAVDVWSGTEMDRWREEYLESVAAAVADETGASVTTALPEGDPAEMLQAEAEAVSAGLVVLSSHGRGLVARSWLGSVATALMHHATVPLLVIRPPDEEEAGEGEELPTVWRPLRTILVALDGTPESEGVMESAVTLARLYGAALRLVRVAPFPRAYSSPYIPHAVEINREVVNAEETRARKYLDEALERLVPDDVRADGRVVVTAQPARGILAEAAEVDADLLALASHHGTLHRLALGSTADRVVRASHRPVLLVRTGGG